MRFLIILIVMFIVNSVMCDDGYNSYNNYAQDAIRISDPQMEGIVLTMSACKHDETQYGCKPDKETFVNLKANQRDENNKVFNINVGQKSLDNYMEIKKYQPNYENSYNYDISHHESYNHGSYDSYNVPVSYDAPDGAYYDDDAYGGGDGYADGYADNAAYASDYSPESYESYPKYETQKSHYDSDYY